MRFSAFAAAAVLAAALQSSAVAQSSQPQTQSPTAKEGGRVVFVCDRTPESRRAFEREHGAMVFVSASDLARAQTARETWSAPRCITEAELDRFESAMERAQVMRTRGD